MKDRTNKPDPQSLSHIKPSEIDKTLTKSLPQTQDIVDLAIELWRMEKKLSKIQGKFTEDENKSIVSSLERLKRFVKKNNIEVIDYTGQKYNDGMNVDVLQFEKEPGIKHPIIFQTHEPAVSHLGKLYRKAKVIIHE